MVAWWSGRLARRRPQPSFAAEQRAWLVNVKLKWVKDRALDSVVSRERHLRPALHLLDLIAFDPRGHSPARELSRSRSRSRSRRQLGLRNNVRTAAFMRRFPALFRETSGPCFHLTDDALRLHQQELQVLRATEGELIDRLRRLLMLTVDRSLPLHTVDQLRWDMGLPPDYHQTLIPRYSHYFDLVQIPGDERIWLKLLSWDPRLTVSELEKSYGGGNNSSEEEESLAFPVSFTRGFGLKRKCLSWLQEWQTLPYTSPYAGASGLDRRTDVSEKRIVGVFHELLHLTLGKKTERQNMSNLRKPLALPHKFTKVFERHPGIFYLSHKLARQTVVLREAYDGGREPVIKHPLMGIREQYMSLMRAGMLERSRGGSGKDVEEVATEGEDAQLSDTDEDNESDDGYDSYQESDESSISDSDSLPQCDNDEIVDVPNS